jgi:CDP-paratose 2-epimerase
LLQAGAEVTIFDNLSRAGSATNLAWLREQPGNQRLRFIPGDVRDAQLVAEAVADRNEIYHLAAQVAVTTSLDDPQLDFEINLCGTFNVLEGARKSGRRPFLLFTSTNKVYGAIEPPRECIRRNGHPPKFEGINEDAQLDFHSPYGCSKGAADQYVRDYARVFSIPTVVFRMSCIYGPHQFGNEDQGWIAHFAISALLGRAISIYGDGSQVRDVLYVDDLVAAMETARMHLERTAGHIYNIGGGQENAVSLLEVIAELERLSGRRIRLTHGPWRVGDQRVYVSDTRSFQRVTGWIPRVSVKSGVARLYGWLSDHRVDLEQVAEAPLAVAS